MIFIFLEFLVSMILLSLSVSSSAQQINCETLKYADRNLPATRSCIKQLAKECTATKKEEKCRRAVALEKIRSQIAAQPENMKGYFWRMEDLCKSFEVLNPVYGMDFFKKEDSLQATYLKNSMMCLPTSELGIKVRSFCSHKTEQKSQASLLERFRRPVWMEIQLQVCSGEAGSAERMLEMMTGEACRKEVNKTCLNLFFRSIDTRKSQEVHEKKLANLCSKDKKGLCKKMKSDLVVKQVFDEISKQNKLHRAQTLDFLQKNFPNRVSEPISVDFEKNPDRAYKSLLEALQKNDKILYHHAKSKQRNEFTKPLFELDLLGKKIKFPVRSCNRPGTSEVPDRNAKQIRTIISVECSPHNRLRIEVTAKPEVLDEWLKNLPDPGLKESWHVGRVVGFSTTGVVTKLIVAIL